MNSRKEPWQTQYAAGPMRWLRLYAALVVLVALASSAFPAVSLDRKLSDFYFRLRPSPPTSTRVAIVFIDDASLSRFGRWPWSRGRLAELVGRIAAFSPAVIGLDVLLSEPENGPGDNELASAMGKAGNVVLAAKISSSLNTGMWEDPLPIFQRNAAALGHVEASLDPDGICRRIPVTEPTLEEPRAAFALKLAEQVTPDLAKLESPASSLGDSAILRRFVPDSITINFRPQITPGEARPSFLSLSAADVLEGKAGSQVRGKVVLVGFGTTEIGDRLLTPLSNQMPMPGVEVNANIVQTLLSDGPLHNLDGRAELALLLFSGAVFLWMVSRWPGMYGIGALALTVLLGYALGYELFSRFHLLIHFGPVLLAAVIAAPLAQLENLVSVDRAITRRLQDLAQTLGEDPLKMRTMLTVGANTTGRQLHWKLEAVRRLQTELASLYLFDQTLLEAMREGLVVFGGGGEVVFHNSSWTQFCHRAAGGPIETIADLLEVTGAWEQLAELRTPAGAARGFEREVDLNQCLWRLRAVSLALNEGSDHAGIMLLVEDINARRERDVARAEAISFVTHELRTPLIAIQGFAEFMVRYPERSTREAPETIFRESRRLIAMINAYLEVLRLEVGSRSLRLRSVKVADMVNHVQQIVSPLAQAARITVQVHVDSRVTNLECDESLISGALLNLCSNALKYSPPGSEVAVGVQSNHESMEFTVHNSGPAIPAEELPHLFEPFYRGPQQADNKAGWGIGLAFVKRISEQHGGTVSVSSDGASGTCFRFMVPIAPTISREVPV